MQNGFKKAFLVTALPGLFMWVSIGYENSLQF
jgi:hypothetical protein